jgi:AAA domain
MSKVKATLFLICGKMAAGKSMLAAKLSTAPSTILISEDQWLARLYKPEMRTVADYIQYSARLREVMGPHVEYLLRIGTSVVLDFPPPYMLSAPVAWSGTICGLRQHPPGQQLLAYRA